VAGDVFPVGPNVAIEIVDDGMVSEPKYLHPLVLHALEALDEPEGFGLNIYTRMLMSAAATTDAVRGLIADGLRAALGGTIVSRKNAEAVQRTIAALGEQTRASSDVLGLADVKRDASKGLPNEPEADWEAFWKTIRAYSEPDTAEVLNTVGDLLQQVSTKGMSNDWRPDLRVHLSAPDVAFILEEALAHVVGGSPLLAASLRHSVLPTLWRQPVELTEGMR
jgi:hypothetical protein